MNALLNTEIEERIEAFEIATKTLRDWIERWKRAGAFAVVDTTVFLEHSDKLEEWDLAEEIGARSNPVHILVPLAVVDELDKRKKIGDNHRRWRAGYSVALLDKLLRFDRVSVLREADWEPADGRPRGEVTIEVVMDAPGHVRLSDVDSEIVARAASLQVLAGRPIKLVTYDTGMAMRARFAGIGAVHLRKDLGPEPPTS